MVAAQLLDIHRDQGFVLEDEDAQSGKHVIHETAYSEMAVIDGQEKRRCHLKKT